LDIFLLEVDLRNYLIGQIKIKGQIVHTFEVIFWTFFKTNFRTRTTFKLCVFKNDEGSPVGIHTKLWCGITPNREDVLFKRGSNMH